MIFNSKRLLNDYIQRHTKYMMQKSRMYSIVDEALGVIELLDKRNMGGKMGQNDPQCWNSPTPNLGSCSSLE